MHNEYKSPVIRWYRESQQDATRGEMLTRIDAAESLIASIDLEKTYPAAEILSRIEGKPLPEAGNRKISGNDLVNDLRLLVEDLSDLVELAADAVGEQVFTVEELAKQFNVSTKTISRWRALGLVSRRLVFDGRKRVGFLRSSVDRFIKNNAERVERGSRFSQLTDEQRDEFVDRAREMAHVGSWPGRDRSPCWPNEPVEASRRFVPPCGPTIPSIPSRPFSPPVRGPLTDVQKSNIFRAYRRGVSVDKLCRDYNRTKTTVYRVINEMRAERIKELPLDFIDNPRFARKGADNAILGPMPEVEHGSQSAASVGSATLPGQPVRDSAAHPRAGAALVPHVQLPEVQGDQAPQPTRLRASQVVADGRDRRTARADRRSQESDRACNLRLVVSIAKRHVKPDQNFFELVSDGNLSLLRAVEKFDFARGNKFSTYASWAIMKNFARTIPGEYRQRDRFRTSYDELFDLTQENRGNPMVEETAQQDRVSKIQRVLSRLDERERQIIVGRFGLDHIEGTADFERSRRGTRRDQGTHPADRSPCPDQIASSRARREDRARDLNRRVSLARTIERTPWGE